MGSVYEVIHLETERRRALKVMHAHFAESADFRERFKREARVAAQFESDYIVDVFDAGVDEATGMPFLAMELLRGEELARTLRRVGRLPPPEVVNWLFQTSLALDRTHKAGVVHRDLKPENIYLCERDDGPPQIKVLDFGIAKIATSSKGAGQATNNVGTPLYMAPEQFLPGTDVTASADIYALGLLAYTLLVGTDYWHEELERDDNVFALALIAMKGPPEAPSVRAMRVAGILLSPAFDAWFARVTAMSPAARFASASEAVRALGEALRIHLPPPRPMATSSIDVDMQELAALNSRDTPIGGSSTTMELRPPTRARRFTMVAAAATILLLGAGTLALRKDGTANLAGVVGGDKVEAPATAAVESKTPPNAALGAPGLAVAPAPVPSEPAGAAHEEPKSADHLEASTLNAGAPANGAAAPPKARAKPAKSAVPKTPKPIYSRD
jgi:serine/threonine-protein kinase